jgi:hypothetical protein
MVIAERNGVERVVALDAYDKRGRALGIRLQGAQIVKAGNLVRESEREAFAQMIDAQARDPSVPADSHGVPGSIYQTNIDIPLASEAPMPAQGDTTR